MLYLDTITWRGEKTGGPHLWNPNRPRVHWSRSQPQSQLIVQCMPVHAQEHSGPTDCPWQKQEGVSPLLPTLPHHKWSHMRGSQHLLISEPEKCQRVQSKNMTENKDGGKMVVGENHVKISICKINNGKIRLSQKKYKILPLVVKKIHQKKHWKLQKKNETVFCVSFFAFFITTQMPKLTIHHIADFFVCEIWPPLNEPLQMGVERVRGEIRGKMMWKIGLVFHHFVSCHFFPDCNTSTCNMRHQGPLKPLFRCEDIFDVASGSGGLSDRPVIQSPKPPFGENSRTKNYPEAIWLIEKARCGFC